MKFKFEVLDPDEVRLARDIIKERIAMSVGILKEIQRQVPTDGKEIPGEHTKLRDTKFKETLEAAKKHQEMLTKFDNDYLDYLTSELKKLPVPEIDVCMDDREGEEPVAWKA